MIAVDEAGTGPPIVLLHGVGTNRVVWRRVAPLLAGRRRVLAPDLPGLGESGAAGPGFGLDAVADALAAALAPRAGAPFDLVGNSLGGAVAIALAARRPELVRRLVLSAPVGLAPRGAALARAAAGIGAALVAGRRRVGAPLAGSATARRVLLWGTVADPAALSAADAREMFAASRGSRRVGPALATAIAADLRPRLAALTVPVGVIWGERDRTVRIAALDALRETVPGVAVETLPETGHVPQIEGPAAFVAAVERLLARLAAVTAS